MTTRLRRAVLAAGLACLLAAGIADRPLLLAQGNRSPKADRDRGVDAGIDRRMSGAGRLAQLAASGRLDKMIARARAAHQKKLDEANGILAKTIDDGRDEAESPDDEGPTGGQAETSIAIDATGQHVVVGVNDTRGFGLNPISVSGFAYSDDGGATFTDGGQLPVTTGTSSIGGTLYPEVFGDPEVKYLGGSTFIYFSIVLKNVGGTAVQAIGFHRSTDNGHSWQGPFDIPPATRSGDAADKEFADVDAETGRVIMTWSNFRAAGGVDISSTFSDNITAATPTWSARKIIANGSTDGQMSIPRFAGNATPGKTSNNVYVAWARFTGNSFRNIGFARSTDNGATFGTPANLASDFLLSDEALGNDRSNNAPSLAVDTSGGPFHGYVYVTYENNNNLDGGDIVVQRSTDQGVSFSTPIRINSRGSLASTDRSQWFPWVTVDRTSGRVYVFFYDQGIAADSDLTEVSYAFSDDGGVTWSKPMPLSDRPFHAGYGNDTGQPNIGDYNQAVAQNGALSAVWAGTPPLVGFADGEPGSASMTVPDMYYKRVAAGTTRISAALGTVSFADAGSGSLAANGFIDPGEQISFTLPLRNYVTNPLMASALTGVSATLSTSTPGVLVTQSGSAYPNLNGSTAYTNNTTPFVVSIGNTFAIGTHLDFTLTVTSAQGSTALPFTVATGSPLGTTLLTENFTGGLPATWLQTHVGGSNTVTWATRSLSLGPSPAAISQAAYHINANDGLLPNGLGDQARWERLLSPSFVVPANAEYVTVDFDVAYDTEEEPSLNVLGYDGLVLRLQDLTAGRISRFVAAEAFAEEFTTGSSNSYPRRLLRLDDGASYLQDLSAWSGNSRGAPGADANGFRHVHLKFPGMAGSTAKLSFEYTQDTGFDCKSPRPADACGVLVDNVVVQSVVSKKPTNVTLTSSVNPSAPGQSVVFTATVTAADGSFAPDGTVTFREGATVLAGPIAISGGQAMFATSALALGSHTITADYVSTSGALGSASACLVQLVAYSLSIDDVSVVEGANGVRSATFTVSLSQATASPVTVQYATADGSATLADFDYRAASGVLTFAPGELTRPVVVSIFGDARYEPDETVLVNLSNPTNAAIVDAQGVATIVNDDAVGPTVDNTTVNQAIVAGAERLRLLQNADGGWYFVATATSCGRGAGVSCPNTIGVTALAMLAAYQRTGNAQYLNAAVASGNAIVAQFNATPTHGLPHTQDVEFLAELASITGNATYQNVATAWFQVVKNTYGTASANVDQWLADRDHVISHGQRSLAAWDLASLIRSAKAAGEAQYALDLANRIVEDEPLWRQEDPLVHPADNPNAYDYTLIGEGSLLWAFHDLPGFGAKIDEYRSFLLAQQDAPGSWNAGNLQRTAYIVLGLAAVGGDQAEAAIRSAMAYYLAHQLPEGGWPSAIAGTTDDVEITEIDSEIVRAMFTLFNTPAGSSITVAPAQLSAVTFSTVTLSGMTSVFGVDPSRLPPLPAGYQLLNGLAYRATTTASFSGDVTACFGIPWVQDRSTFVRLRVLQVQGGGYVDRTIRVPDSPAPDFDAHRICARTPTLEPFVIATRGPAR